MNILMEGLINNATYDPDDQILINKILTTYFPLSFNFPPR